MFFQTSFGGELPPPSLGKSPQEVLAAMSSLQQHQKSSDCSDKKNAAITGFLMLLYA